MSTSIIHKLKAFKITANLKKSEHETLHSSNSFLPPLAGVVLLLYLGGQRRWRCCLVGILTAVEVNLNVLWDVGSALVIGLHLPQSLLVVILADILDKAPDVPGEDSGSDVFVYDLSDLYL